jgi:hypothetical protein
MPLELLGMGVAARHHRRALGDPQVGLPQRDPVLPRQAVQSSDRRMQKLGIGWKGDRLRLHRGVDRDPLVVVGTDCTGDFSWEKAIEKKILRVLGSSEFSHSLGHFQTSADAITMSAFLPLATTERTSLEVRFVAIRQARSQPTSWRDSQQFGNHSGLLRSPLTKSKIILAIVVVNKGKDWGE